MSGISSKHSRRILRAFQKSSFEISQIRPEFAHVVATQCSYDVLETHGIATIASDDYSARLKKHVCRISALPVDWLCWAFPDPRHERIRAVRADLVDFLTRSENPFVLKFLTDRTEALI